MKRLIYIFTIVVLIVSCDQSTKNIGNTNLVANDKDLLIEESFTLEDCDTINGEVCFFIVEEMPEFGNGKEDIKRYFMDNIEYPETAIEDSIYGRVYTRFVVNEDGSVSDPETIRGVRYDLDEECIRVVENMPDWKPGKQQGKFVKVYYIVPISFSLDSDSKKNSITPKKVNEINKFEFKIYPNPASEYVNLEFSELVENLKFDLVNTSGQITKSGNIYSLREQVNISDLEQGLYIIRITSKKYGLVKTQKLIKK